MKAKLICVLFLFYCFPCISFSQIITLKVDKNCRAFIMLDDKNLADESINKISVGKEQNLLFRLINPSDNDIVITIKTLSSEHGFAISDLQNTLTVESPVFTDNKLNLIIDNKRYNLAQPFRIYIGCKNENIPTIYADFISSVASGSEQNTVTSNTASQSDNSTNDNAIEAPVYIPGSAVYDALKLADKENLTEYEYKKIMKFYFPNDVIDDIAKASLSAKKNPFLNGIIDSTYQQLKSTDEGIAESGNDILSQLSLSSIGGLDITSIADGLAKFLVKRAKEELSISFFERLKKTLDSIPDLQTLFPATTDLLSSAGSNVYDYKKYIQNLRESFKTDIQTLDENLPGIIDNHPVLFDKYHALAASLRSGCYFTGELKRQVHPGDILANYPLEFLANESKNWSGAVQTLQLLSASFRDTASADSTYWVNIKYIRQTANDKRALKIYFGLLYQNAINNYNSIPFEDKTLVDVLNELATQYDKYDVYFNSYKLYIMRFAEKTDVLNKMIKSYTKPASDSLAIELYKKYFDAASDMIDYTAQVGQLPFINKGKFIADLPAILSPYLTITKATSDLVIDINRKNYSSAINHAVYIYGKVRTEPSKIEAVALQVSSATSAIKPSELTFKPAVDSFARSETALNKLVKYGGFMAVVSTAQSSDEVESAIEAFALPTGSSAVKRTSSFNVSVNAYAGLFYGTEKIRKYDTGNTKPNVYGVTAPIGVAASWGHRIFFIPTGQHAWSTSLYISLIDLGAVAAFRFRDTATAQVPTIQLKDIFSPGAFLSVGIPKTPLSFNVGAQAGPNLRKVSDKTNDYSNNIYWRYSVSLCVDIPIFNLYTR